MLKTRSNKSIIRIFLLSMLFISFVSTAIIGYLWISEEFRVFAVDAEKMREEYIESQKLLIKNEIHGVIDYIEYMRSKIERRLKESLQERVYEAHGIASNIYERYKNQKSDREIKQLIKDALRTIRFNKGRGHFYIYTMTGVLELWPTKPHSEGENQLDFQDNQGVYVVRNEIQLLKTQQEGFLVNTWKDPQRNPRYPGMVFSKVSFVKYFKPFNWYIGGKEYWEDFLEDIQREILERIGKISFGEDGYIFVVDFDGVTLWNDIRPDLIGKKVWATQGPNGENIIHKAREAAEKPGGGFIEYTWFKLKDKVPMRKTSFVMAITDWQWIVGAGVYLDEIDRVIAQRKLQLKKDVKDRVIKIIALFLLIFLVVLFITLMFSRRLRNEFEVFLSFFRKAAISHEEIDRDKLFAEEFKILADSANRMLGERQAIENSLKESEERLAVTFRSLTEGVITTDIEQRVVFINHVAEELTGWGQQEARGKPVKEIFQVLDEQTKEPLPNPVDAAVTRGEIVGLTTPAVLMSRQGTQRLIANSAAPIRDYEGKIVGAVVVFQDITEKQRMEEELEKAQKLEALGILAGGIAHDFNNLLTGIMGNISLAKLSATSPAKLQERLDQAEKATVKAKQLTQQLLTFARGGAPVKKVHAVPGLINESVSFALRGSNVKCEFTMVEDPWAVEADEDQLYQVFNNLIINAVQSMPEGGTIYVSVENVASGADTGLPLADKKYVKIAIKDAGTGIPNDMLKKVFDPYFSTKPKGSGLGLTLAYSIIKKHEGIIDIESHPGEGSTFTVYIPASFKKEIPKPQPEESARDEGAGDVVEAGDGEKRVLVMDDDQFVGDAAVKMLTHLGYQPQWALNGQSTISLYKKALEENRPFQVVIMDLTIPGGMGGAEAIKKLREIDPQIKAIVSSGYSTDPIMADFKQYGFRACIKKPYRLKELSQILDQVIGKQ